MIDIAIEEKITSEVNESPLYSIILDQATDISVTKQLGISIQYLDNNAVVRNRNLKLLAIIHGTADVITEAVISYLISNFFSRSAVRTTEHCEMQKALNEHHLKLQRPTETRWLSHQSAVDALQRSIKAVYAM